MARSNNNLNAVLKDTANAIRGKKGTSEPIIPRDFADEIESIQTGGGGSGSDSEKQLLTGQLMSYTVPSGVVLRNYCFYSCYDIQGINLNQVREVPNSCFANCSSLSFIIGNELRSISYYGFYNCPTLSEISFPKLANACSYAFGSCVRVTKVSVPELTMCSEGAFAACSSLSELNLPNLISAGNSLIANCSILSNISCPNLLVLSGMIGGFSPISSLHEIDFPNLMECSGSTFALLSYVSYMNFYKLYFGNGTSIFRSCNQLENLSIKFGYGAIKVATFQSCFNLSSFSFPLAFPNNEQSVFNNCSKLSQVTMGLSGSIANNTFVGCSSLESVCFLYAGQYIPTLAANAFNGTPMSDSSYLGRFGSIYVPSAMVASFKAATNWIAYSDRITALPSEYDAKFAYEGEFHGRSDLTAIPSEKQNIEYALQHAFADCTNLETINLPNCKFIGRNNFYASKASMISLPNCEFIDDNAFWRNYINMSLLTSLDFPKVKVIVGSFIMAPNVQNINLPECVYIGNYTFSGFSSCSIVNCSNVKYIGQFAFSGMRQLTNINLPECLFLSNGAFYGCNSLTDISVPKLKLMNGAVFCGCTSLTDFSAPELTFIDGTMGGFSSCTSLVNFYAPKLINVPGCCFQNTKISSFNFSNICSVGGSAFASCYQLTKVKLDFISQIWGNVFANCTQLSKVLLPALMSIGINDNFSNCQKLESVYMFAKTVVNMSQSNNFRHCPIASDSYLSGRYGSIYVPASLVSAYQNHSVWSWYSDRFVGLTDEEMQSIIDHWDD